MLRNAASNESAQTSKTNNVQKTALNVQNALVIALNIQMRLL